MHMEVVAELIIYICMMLISGQVVYLAGTRKGFKLHSEGLRVALESEVDALAHRVCELALMLQQG